MKLQVHKASQFQVKGRETVPSSLSIPTRLLHLVSIQPALDLWVFHYFCPSWPVHLAICYISLSADWIIRPIDCAIFCMASNFIISFPALIHLPLRSHLLMFDRSTEVQQAGNEKSMLYNLLQLHMPGCSIYLVANIAATHRPWLTWWTKSCNIYKLTEGPIISWFDFSWLLGVHPC